MSEEIKKQYRPAEEGDHQLSNSVVTGKPERKTAQSVESAVDVTTADMEAILQTKGQATIHVTGKSGAGKTFYTEKLGDELNQKGLKSERISTDDYVEKIPGLGKHRHNLAKLAADIEEAQRKGSVVIIEGIIPESSGRFEIDSDYQVFFDAPFDRRMAMRIQREFASKGKSPERLMRGVATEAGKDPDSFQKYEGITPEDDCNLVVNNEYVMEGNPQLFIKDGKFVFTSENTASTEITITKEERDGLRRIDIMDRN